MVKEVAHAGLELRVPLEDVELTVHEGLVGQGVSLAAAGVVGSSKWGLPLLLLVIVRGGRGWDMAAAATSIAAAAANGICKVMLIVARQCEREGRGARGVYLWLC